MCKCPGCDEMSCGLPDCDECEADQMPKSRDEQRADLEAQLAALDDGDDESDEVSVTFPDGKTFSGAFRRVKQVAEANGFKLFPDPPADDKPKSDGGNVKRFSGRRVS